MLTFRSITGDYCDVYLTHDSMSVRKAHNSGRNHLRNVVEYYQREFRTWCIRQCDRAWTDNAS